jgi:CRISPR-associated protein Csx14
MPGLEHTHTLLATLGGQPQVVTFTLDLLLQRHIPIREVIVVHPASQPKLQHSIACLNAEFPGDRYQVDGRTIHFRRHVLRDYDRPIDDIVDERTADGALNTMDELIHGLKRRQCIVHFSITGGRRLMSFLSVSAALLNFEPADRLWHLYTPEAVAQRVRDGAIMHVQPEDGVQLIEVPFARLAQPILSHLLSSNHSDARAAIRSQTEQREAEEHAKCSQVVNEAKPAQRKVLRAIAKGLYPQDVAALLNRNLATINSHTNVLYGLCRNAWNIPGKVRVDYRFLQMKFANYFTDDE